VLVEASIFEKIKLEKTNNYSLEVREHSACMVLENVKEYPSGWTAIKSIAAKAGVSVDAGHLGA